MNDIKKTIADMNDDGKKKKEQGNKNKDYRFTALDFFFIVVVLLCVVGIGFRGTIAEFFLKAEPTQTITIHFKTNTDNLKEEEVAGIQEGTEFFFDGKNRHSFGVVTQVEKKEEHEDRYSARGTIAVKARYTDSGLVLKDNHSVRVGETFNIYSGNYTVCVQITKIPEK